MMIGLHDAEADHMKDKKFPNLALMKLSAWHKAAGDQVQWWNCLLDFDRIYSSKVFDFTPENIYLPQSAIRGGTGYPGLPIDQTLTEEVDRMFPDYTIYPECGHAIGYITRGCPNHCRWCIVPKKEGMVRPYRKWQEVVRKDSNKLILMDNNILSLDYGLSQLEELAHSGYELDLNQGMDARLVDESVAKLLSKIKWIRYLRFSCDQKAQLEKIRHVVELLGKNGIKPYQVFVYLLVTRDLKDASERVEELKKISGLRLYAQAERNGRLGIVPSEAQLEFQQRYIYRGNYRRETWQEYCERKGLFSYLA